MGLNLAAIQSRLDNMKQNQQKADGDSPSDYTWKPPTGKSQIRIVPYAHNKENPFNELYFHYRIAKYPVLSPVTYGNADPVAEFAEKLTRTGDKEDWKLSRKLQPKMRVYVPVIVRGEEEKGVRYWGFGKMMYQDLMGFLVDPDYGDITDLKEGRDLTIERTEATTEDGFPTYSLRVKPNKSMATEDATVADMIVNRQKDLKEIFVEPSYSELEGMLKSYLRLEDDSSSDNTEVKGATSAKKVEDVKSSFDKLFGSADSTNSAPF